MPRAALGRLHPRETPVRFASRDYCWMLQSCWKIADLIWALSALSARHNKIYSCTEKPIKAFVP